MKVLAVATNTYNPKYKEFTRTRSGYGYMVNDIVCSTANIEDIYLLTHQFTPGYNTGKYTILAHTKFDVIRHATIRNVIQGIRDFFLYKESLGLRLRNLYYLIDKGCFEYYLEALHPDIVHIHGLTISMKPYVDVCKQKGINFMITLHGLNGKVQKVSKHDKEYERSALNELSELGILVSVVSSGVRNDIKRLYGIESPRIQVILNGTRICKKIPEKKKHDGYNIVCIGNISSRKNQMQLIRAFRLLDDDFQKNVMIHFCGDNPESIDIEGEIAKCNYPQNIIYHGFIERSELDELWASADLNVVASIVEGFGLSIIEGYSRGIPTLTFSDLSACIDLYDECAMICVDERTDTGLKNGIEKAINAHWDASKIHEWSKHFSLDAIAEKYVDTYKRIIET